VISSLVMGAPSVVAEFREVPACHGRGRPPVKPITSGLGIGPVARQITALVRAIAQSRKSISLPPSSLCAAFTPMCQSSAGIEPAALAGAFYTAA
jgi:hypothetical protein